MKKTRVLIVEDEQTLAHILKDTLETMEFEVTLASDGEEGLRLFRQVRPDVLVADVMMPRISGFDMVAKIRAEDKATPVLFLTARTSVDDVVEGFGLGANDYLRKPFAIPELVVRLRSLAGRAEDAARAAGEAFVIGAFRLGKVDNRLTDSRTGESGILPNREAEILKALCRERNSTVPTRRLLLDLWGDDDFFNTRSLQVLITRLRHRLGADPSVSIVNVRGEGYRLVVSGSEIRN